MAFVPYGASASGGGDERVGGVLDRVASNGGEMVKQLGLIVQALTGALPFQGASGTFTCAAASTTVVANSNVLANSVVLIVPSNAAGATLMGGAKSLYLSARTAGTSFTVATANATAAAGTETFLYLIANPST